jgi:DNA-binding beta-propeller fold protein YncE
MRRRWLAGLGVLLAVLTLTAAAPGASEVGPAQRLLPNGRQLEPQGTLVGLGNFPTGGALTPDGRFYWTVSTGRGFNDVRIVSVRDPRVVQVLPIPGASGGITMDPKRNLAYVSGVADSEHLDQDRPGLPGREGDVVHVYRYDAASGRAAESGTIAVPPPPGSPIPQSILAPPGLVGPPQSFPPTNTKRVAWPDRLASSPDGKTLLVPLNLADSAAIVDVASKRVRYVDVGHYPYGAAITRDGRTGLVSNETDGTVTAIDLGSGRRVKEIQVGAHLSHPEAIAIDPKADRAYVAVANSDQVAVLDTRSLTVERTLAVGRPEGLGTSPVDLTVTPDGRRLLVAEAGADEIAVFALPGAAAARLSRRARRVLEHESRAAAAQAGRAARGGDGDEAAPRAAASFDLIGRIPTSDYPADVDVAETPCSASREPASTRPGARRESDRTGPGSGGGPRVLPRGGVEAGAGGTASCPRLVYVSGKGLGVGPNPNGPSPLSPANTDDRINSFRYLPSIVDGQAGVLDLPADERIRALTQTASRQIRPSNAAPAPPDTPLRPGGPIKHVFYVVRENRTYDQVLGSLGRGDGDPSLNLFGPDVVPNIRALSNRFGLLDRVFANSEASIDGHFWTSAAKVSDYVNKSWFQNYAARGRPFDFGVFSVTFPPNGFLFDQAERQGIPYFNYGEAVAGVVPLTDKDRHPDETAEVGKKFAKSDLGPPVGCYPNDAAINRNPITQNETFDSTPPAGASRTAESRFDCFKARFKSQLLLGQVPAFNYMVLSNDHTVGTTPGQRTPQALMADNDYGLGQIVEEISHSSIWDSSAIFVIEDDSQDGADHVDAHRIPAAVISPYAKRGQIVHERYDFLSVIRSMELILGMKPLGLFDQLATPMYDAFQGAPANAEPYSAAVPAQDRLAKNTAASPNAKESRGLNLEQTDRAPQRVLDRILWQAVHGAHAKPPPPGPNGVPGG